MQNGRNKKMRKIAFHCIPDIKNNNKKYGNEIMFVHLNLYVSVKNFIHSVLRGKNTIK